MNRVALWYEGARPKTLVSSISPVLIGTAIAIGEGYFDIFIFLATLLFSLCIQIGTNFANDYFDFIKGADTHARKGPRRLVQSGLIDGKAMKRATHLTFILAGLLALYMVSIGGVLILIPLLFSILFGYLYTAGPFSLAYLGISDLFVLIFFGFVATAGTTFLQTKTMLTTSILAGMGPGFLSMALLALNNLRDVKEDTLANKKTLPVRFGEQFGKMQYVGCIIGAALSPFLIVIVTGHHFLLLSTWLVLCSHYPHVKTLFSKKAVENIAPLFKKATKISILYMLFFTISYLINI